MRSILVTLVTAILSTGPMSAYAAGPNGGQTTVADGHPIEFVSTDTELTFFVTGEDGKGLDTAGMNAKAFVQAAGKSDTITLTPSPPNRLVGVLKAPLNSGSKVVLSAKIHGHNLQARFEK
ncbi:hypothetical protein [Methylobacterium oxalidis]|uniref:hypothetical protein n=1 Tax=Methylobacterium oxalidis TaxID=944322 RepID=UPI0033150384